MCAGYVEKCAYFRQVAENLEKVCLSKFFLDFLVVHKLLLMLLGGEYDECPNG